VDEFRENYPTVSGIFNNFCFYFKVYLVPSPIYIACQILQSNSIQHGTAMHVYAKRKEQWALCCHKEAIAHTNMYVCGGIPQSFKEAIILKRTKPINF